MYHGMYAADICFWSTPAAPLWRTIEALSTEELSGAPDREVIESCGGVVLRMQEYIQWE
jgi:hypothetical protein